MGAEPRWLPWIGARYWTGTPLGVRLLLLGESMYLVPPESVTPDLLQSWIKRIVSGDWSYPFYTRVYQTVAGRHWRESTLEEVAAFWQSVAFYNYVQSPVGDRARQRPSADAWRQSRAAFVGVVERLKPEAVLVLGKTLWCRLIDLGLLTTTINESDGTLNVGPRALASYIYHPSSLGFSWRRWSGHAAELIIRARRVQERKPETSAAQKIGQVR